MLEATNNQMQAQRASTRKDWLTLNKVDHQTVLFFLGSLIFVRVLGIFTLPFTDTTEARYAEIARKMVETQDWITPQFQYGVPFWGKPPLHTWLSALGMELFGVTPFGARALIFACSALLIWVLYRWVRDEMGAGAALVAITILSSSVLFFVASAFVMTDLVMTLGICLTMVSLWKALNDQDSKIFNGLLVFVGLAIGLMAKGPVAVVLCGIPIVLWGAISGRWRAFGSLPWVKGLALVCALTLPWYIAAELKTPGFLNYFIIGEHYERFLIPDWQGDLYGSGHERPKGAIWGDWVLSFLPWSLAFLVVLFKGRRAVSGFARDDRGWRSYLLVWALSPLILFTMSANILAAYTLPGLPASAILLVVIATDIYGARMPHSVRTVFSVFSSFILIVGVLYAILALFAPHEINLRSERELVRELTRIDPTAQLYYFNYRSYSGEFYTAGRAKSVSGRENLKDLPRRPHALAINAGHEIAHLDQLEEAYDRVGKFGRHVLYVFADQNKGVDQ